jgi:hypothetical protein
LTNMSSYWTTTTLLWGFGVFTAYIYFLLHFIFLIAAMIRSIKHSKIDYINTLILSAVFITSLIYWFIV